MQKKLSFKSKTAAYTTLTSVFVIISLIMNVVSVISVPTFTIGGETIYVPWALPLAAIMMVVADILSEVFTKKQVVKSIILGYLGGAMLSAWLLLGQLFVGNHPENNLIIIENGKVIAHFLPWDALGQSWRFFLAGFIAYMVSNFANTGIMWKLRSRDGEVKVWKRIVVSTIIGQLLDNAIFITLAFAPFGISMLERSWNNIMWHIIIQFGLEVGIEMLVSPISVRLISKIKQLPKYHREGERNEFSF